LKSIGENGINELLKTTMKTIAFVPIKLNNTRLPNKNIKSFDNGQPLCSYILQTLLQVRDIDEIYVYCSNPLIKKYIPNSIKFLERNSSLDQDSTKINEVLMAFANDVPADIYLMAHATAPFVKVASINKGLMAVKSKKYDSAFAAKKLQTFLWKNDNPFNYDLNSIPRTQDIEPFYEETSGFYIYNSDIICTHHRRIGNNPFIVEVSTIESVDIDEQEDFDIANAIFNQILK
jgi:CMP-N-acetylneuraminic acid synthetase